MREGYDPPVPFDAGELALLRRHARLMGGTFDLDACARKVGRSRADTNRMLEALLGRTPAEAAEVLNAQAAPTPRNWAPVEGRLTRAMKAFMAEVFDER